MNRSFQFLAIIFFIGTFLWFGKPFLIPIAYALLIALVLYPITQYLEKHKFGRTLSVVLPILLLCMIFFGLVSLLAYEAALIGAKWPLIQQQLDPFMSKLQAQLERDFGWTTADQTIWLRESLKRISENMGAFLKNSLKATFEALFNLIIIPIYVGLLLLFRGRLVTFLSDLTPQEYKDSLPKVLADTVKVFSRFIRGMLIVYLSVGVLNSFGIWALGVEDALLFGMLSAIMTIIPYFGIIISALLPVTISWLHTGSIWQPLGVIAVFAFVQYLEANLIFPYVVGRYVNLNTLAAILAIFLGALLWGVSGMILFLPFLAVFRIFADHFPAFKPWGDVLKK